MHALGVGLSIMMMAILLVVLTACSHSYYRDGEIEISRWSLGTDLNLEEASGSYSTDGSRQFKVQGASSEQSKSLEAAARGAAEGAAKALAPTP